ncbi:helix-turn-helix domain-containing protein [Celeribacter sp.]|uniref:helix-turn-helix transcriptional regulator n=1 Tax=Celeribacter sp. TaxID=1890673 RepID=UPI003A95B855
MPHIHLRQSVILDNGAAFHVSRAVLDRARPKPLHTQDYHELFWLVNGKARLHLEDHKHTLVEGDLVFVPCDTPHGLQGVGEACHIVNIIVPSSEVSALLNRYPQAADFFAPSGHAPVLLHRGIRALSRLSSAAVTLESAPRTTLSLEAFLLPLISELVGDTRKMPDGVPAWLKTALIAADDPDTFQDGAAGLVAATGKSHAHVSRSMQKYFAMTPSDYINARRMDHAARLLAGTPDSLTEIAESLGISNMSHFHRLFRAQFNMTPRRYREKNQKGVIQPV